MLFVEGWRFLLDIVMRVCPCVESKHLHILYDYIPAVGREREDIVTESNFCNKDYVLYCWYIYMLLNMIMGYSKHPCQSSKRCKLVCKRSSVWDFTSVLMEDVKENWMSFFTSSIPLWGCLTWSLTGSHGRLLSYIKLKLLTGSLAVPILIAKCRFLTI